MSAGWVSGTEALQRCRGSVFASLGHAAIQDHGRAFPLSFMSLPQSCRPRLRLLCLWQRPKAGVPLVFARGEGRPEVRQGEPPAAGEATSNLAIVEVAHLPLRRRPSRPAFRLWRRPKVGLAVRTGCRGRRRKRSSQGHHRAHSRLWKSPEDHGKRVLKNIAVI